MLLTPKARSAHQYVFDEFKLGDVVVRLLHLCNISVKTQNACATENASRIVVVNIPSQMFSDPTRPSHSDQLIAALLNFGNDQWANPTLCAKCSPC